MMQKVSFILLCAVFVFSISIDAQSKRTQVRHIVERYAKDSLFNGVISVAREDKLIYQGSFGYANKDSRKKITNTTLFPIASLTKQFTAAAILKLQEAGELSVEDDVSKYLDVPPSMKEVQIKHLLSHTSGIPDYWQHDIENTEEGILTFHFNHDTLLFSPGDDHRYCNSGYFFLGQIIEHLSHQSYRGFMESNIFDPLGMYHTFVHDGTEYERAVGYTEDWTENDYLMATPDGGIVSTAEDLRLWNSALMREKVLSKESIELMFAPFQLSNGNVVDYGFGWDVHEANSNIVSHTGWLASFASYNQLDQEKGYSVTLLSNRILPQLMELIIDLNEVLYN